MRNQADLAQFGHALLRRLGLQFTGCLDEWNIGDVNEAHVAGPSLEGELANGLQERQSLDVTDRAADFGDEHVGPRLGGQMGDAPLDFVGDVRNDLHGLAQIHPIALVLEHLLVDLSARRRVGPAQFGIGEALIVPEV